MSARPHPLLALGEFCSLAALVSAAHLASRNFPVLPETLISMLIAHVKTG
jgi:hypothetical protein